MPEGPADGVEPVGLFEWQTLIRRWQPTDGAEKRAKATALFFATYGNKFGGSIHVGQKKLARVVSVSESTIGRHLEILVERGFIERTRRGNRHAQQADEYRLTFPINGFDGRLRMLDPSENGIMKNDLYPSPVTGRVVPTEPVQPSPVTVGPATAPDVQPSPVEGLTVKTESPTVTHDGPPEHNHHPRPEQTTQVPDVPHHPTARVPIQRNSPRGNYEPQNPYYRQYLDDRKAAGR